MKKPSRRPSGHGSTESEAERERGRHAGATDSVFLSQMPNHFCLLQILLYFFIVFFSGRTKNGLAIFCMEKVKVICFVWR